MFNEWKLLVICKVPFVPDVLRSHKIAYHNIIVLLIQPEGSKDSIKYLKGLQNQKTFAAMLLWVSEERKIEPCWGTTNQNGKLQMMTLVVLSQADALEIIYTPFSFIDEETRIWRGEEICPRPHSQKHPTWAGGQYHGASVDLERQALFLNGSDQLPDWSVIFNHLLKSLYLLTIVPRALSTQETKSSVPDSSEATGSRVAEVNH